MIHSLFSVRNSLFAIAPWYAPAMGSSRCQTLLSALLSLVVLAMLGGFIVVLRSTAATSVHPKEGVPPCTTLNPCVALVIDDVGRDIATLEHLLELGADVTYAVLPHAKKTEQSLEAIRVKGGEVILHLPMDPLDRQKITDEPIVLERNNRLTEDMIACLERVPDAVGINNHMGSSLSQDEVALQMILSLAHQRNLWFLDSKTSPMSQICKVARMLHEPCLERNVFLDDQDAITPLAVKWQEVVRLARLHGKAIAIAHLLPSTIEALHAILRRAEVRVQRLSRLVATRDAT
jgi:uncharacterized protein